MRGTKVNWPELDIGMNDVDSHVVGQDSLYTPVFRRCMPRRFARGSKEGYRKSQSFAGRSRSSE